MNTAKQLTQVKVSVSLEIASAFKKVCAASNVSMAAALTQFMAEYSKTPVKPKAASDYSTRRRRRSAIKKIIMQLEQMKDWEEGIRDNIPENLRGSGAYDAAEEAVSSLEEAIDALAECWMVP